MISNLSGHTHASVIFRPMHASMKLELNLGLTADMQVDVLGAEHIIQ